MIQHHRQNLRRLCGRVDAATIEAIGSVLETIRQTPDAQCLELSRQNEMHYLLCHCYRGLQNLRLVRQGLKAVPAAVRPTVLDVGTSPLTFLYKQCLGDVDLRSIDLTSLLEDRCRRQGIIHKACNLVTDAIPFDDGTFDLILFTEVMEHLAVGPGRIFAQFRRVLKPGGRLVFSVPNVANLKNRLTLLLGWPILSPVYRTFLADEDPGNEATAAHGLGHVREYTLGEARDIVRHYGFDVIASRCVDSFRVLPRGGAIKRAAFQLYRLASAVVPNSKMINMVLCAKR